MPEDSGATLLQAECGVGTTEGPSGPRFIHNLLLLPLPCWELGPWELQPQGQNQEFQEERPSQDLNPSILGKPLPPSDAHLWTLLGLLSPLGPPSWHCQAPPPEAKTLAPVDTKLPFQKASRAIGGPEGAPERTGEELGPVPHR